MVKEQLTALVRKNLSQKAGEDGLQQSRNASREQQGALRAAVSREAQKGPATSQRGNPAKRKETFKKFLGSNRLKK